jgi:hypothetical protein
VAAATVGLFEGGFYYRRRLPPQFDCRMRNRQPFCAVCSQRIRENFQCWLGQFRCIET